jgi:hypothetical protein
METVFHINPLLALLIALLFALIAASGRFSLNATNILLFVAWGVGVFAIVHSGLRDRTLKAVAESGVGVLALLISYWVIQRHRRKSSPSNKQ